MLLLVEMSIKLETLGFRLLVLGFATSSWIAINSLWVQLPLLVPELPEGWKLPSYLAILVQAGNLGPLAYFLLRKFSPRWIRPQLAVYVVLGMGIVAMIMTASFWGSVTSVGGTDHSLALLCLTFLLAVVNCSSNVICLPYMCQFEAQFVPVYFMGMGLSGLVPSVIAIVQGVGSTECLLNGTNAANHTQFIKISVPPLFSPDAFFGIIAGLMLLSLICFVLMENMQLGRAYRIPETPEFRRLRKTSESETDKDTAAGTFTFVSTHRIVFYLVVTGWVCVLMDAFLPSIQSYSALPYGSLTYHLVVVLSGIANPVGSLLASFFRAADVMILSAITTVATGASVIVIIIAALSPDPYLIGYSAGGVLPVSLYRPQESY